MKIGFIGCGNMGGALAEAISTVSGVEALVFDFDKEKTEKLKRSCGCIPTDAVELASTCDFIFLGVKPAAVGAAIEGIAEGLAKNANAVIISMAAGVTIEKIENYLPCPHPVIRIMPNTPVAVGAGMTVYAANSLLGEKEEDQFVSFMAATGALDKISEELIDAACAVSGCGPAFAYMFVEALAEGGAKCGLPKEKAMLYASKMIKGAMEMVEKTKKEPNRLKEEVCSPGGSTIEGVHALENGDFPGIGQGAVKAAFEKTKKLGKG
jgi:pyrroline-5-carboxylate reductase